LRQAALFDINGSGTGLRGCTTGIICNLRYFEQWLLWRLLSACSAWLIAGVPLWKCRWT